MIVSYKTDIVLADGSFRPVSRLTDKTYKGWAYLDGEFVHTDITATAVGEQKIYRLRSHTGRVLDISADSSILQEDGNWLDLSSVSHTTRDKDSVMSNVEKPIAELGLFKHFGDEDRDMHWVRTVKRSWFADPEYPEDVSSYLGELNETVLGDLLKHKYYTSSKLRLSDSLSRNRLFHLLSRLGVYSYSTKGASTNRAAIYIQGGIPPTNQTWHAGQIYEFSSSFVVPAYEVHSSHGNLLEKNFLCQTTK